MFRRVSTFSLNRIGPSSNRVKAPILAIAVLTMLFPFSLHSQWSTDPANNLIVGYGLLPEICSDSAGGAYITYENAIGWPRTIELRRLNRYGYQTWAASRLIQGVKPASRLASITSDGRNGVLVAFKDRDEISPPPLTRYTSRLRVQRVDSSGNLLWGAVGARASIAEYEQGSGWPAAIVSDGRGGCIVAWTDSINLLHAQRIDSVGTRAWGDTGVFVASNIFAGPYTPRLQKVSNGDFVVGYASTIFSSFSILQRFDLDGVFRWGNGTRLDFLLMNMISDDRGGVVGGGRRALGSIATIAAQRVDSTGTRVWTEPFVDLADSADLNNNGIPIANEEGDWFAFAWNKQIASIGRAITQRLSIFGSPRFPFNGIQISRNESDEGIGRVQASRYTSTIYLWIDNRSPSGVYGQRLDSVGRQLWDTNDVQVNLPAFTNMNVTTDCNGGCVVAGSHQFDFSIRALQLGRNGNLGEVVTRVAYGRPAEVPESAILYRNFPNPFNPSTTIKYVVPADGYVTLIVFDVLGRQVSTVVNGFVRAGYHQAVLNSGELSSGVYFYRIQAGNFADTKKLLLLR